MVTKRERPTYLPNKPSKHDKKPHQIPRIAAKQPLRLPTAHVLGRGAHRWRDRVPRCVHEQLRKPLKHLLDLLLIRLLQVFDREVDANVGYAACDFAVRLS